MEFTNRQIIEFNEVEYSAALKKYNDFLTIESEIITEATELLQSYKFDSDKLLSEGLTAFYDIVKEKYKKQILLDVSGFKLCYLMDINTDKLKSLLDIYITKKIAAPTKDTFTIYTNSEIENERLKVAEKVIVMLNELQEFTELKALLVQRGLNNCVTYDNHTQKFQPNWYFIKNAL